MSATSCTQALHLYTRRGKNKGGEGLDPLISPATGCGDAALFCFSTPTDLRRQNQSSRTAPRPLWNGSLISMSSQLPPRQPPGKEERRAERGVEKGRLNEICQMCLRTVSHTGVGRKRLFERQGLKCGRAAATQRFSTRSSCPASVPRPHSALVHAFLTYRQCSRCMQTSYCSAACQKAHWCVPCPPSLLDVILTMVVLLSCTEVRTQEDL